MIRQTLTYFFTLLGFSFVLGCDQKLEEPVTKGKIRICTSFLPIHAHTLAITGDLAEVYQLLDQDTGPHDFQLTPESVRELAAADLFIINGAGIEDWMDDLVKKAGNNDLLVIDTSKGVKLLDNPGEIEIENSPGPDQAVGHGHHDGKNPHTWLDPLIALRQVETILQALKVADAANATTYEANAREYSRQLAALDTEFREKLARLPNKNLVSFHEAFPYLAARYGLNYVGAISEFPEKDPAPRELARLVDKIKSLGIGVLFAEQAYAPELLEKIASQTGARVSQLDTLEIGSGSASAYLERMRKNLTALTAAFSQPPNLDL